MESSHAHIRPHRGGLKACVNIKPSQGLTGYPHRCPEDTNQERADVYIKLSSPNAMLAEYVVTGKMEGVLDVYLGGSVNNKM